ncbi:rhomboid family intramembrane serine protease [Paenibacillus sp. 1011MAR3C5]|uniref:rhomboid family intramembrane serine protease n=1 Tax=Paenibacillus sp. 1011MAR3C5 TaxID=1675787 RepID=UPI000E6C1F8E|nr:rhomboid family intramembrane serine protease [Paenibacillus sp. 1011MAR3C5]RJE86929.1 rhomboid family intramembrane serine protease [Paenibacillus sp. 1011MAR3C5]
MFLRRESLREYMRLYPVISIIIVINLVMFGLLELSGGSTQVETLYRFGAMFGGWAIEPELWRFISSMFLHIGFMHLLMNSFSLYVFAAPLERMLGAWKFAVLYLASGIVGNIFSYFLHHDLYIGAGASGGIYGIYGAYLFLSLFRKDVLDADSSKTVTIILIVGIVYSIIVPNVDLYAHVGGFVGGFVFMAILSTIIKRRARRYSM